MKNEKVKPSTSINVYDDDVDDDKAFEDIKFKPIAERLVYFRVLPVVLFIVNPNTSF